MGVLMSFLLASKPLAASASLRPASSPLSRLPLFFRSPSQFPRGGGADASCGPKIPTPLLPTVIPSPRMAIWRFQILHLRHRKRWLALKKWMQ
ncbi:hypothetical protein MUK42_17018 [Musa troglodytarum]|uniref:Uncharacterized protein n=1 Tax=Musa troglodytarum TaxID=320322 RepID=A0A9E7ET85_9LILI|nr:hypothetical protein MUK42_17018 [Musa troglodytarum]URD82206.1 hypothetical protein MUK42_17018 [Musa troglodytarum]